MGDKKGGYRHYRPMRTEKFQRNATLLKYHQDNPGLSYRVLGEKFSMSRQRAYYLIRIQLRRLATESVI